MLLEISLAHVIEAGIAQYMIVGLVWGNAFTTLADDGAEFTLKVGAAGPEPIVVQKSGDDNRLIRADQGILSFGKQNRLSRDLILEALAIDLGTFCDVRTVVEAQANYFLRLNPIGFTVAHRQFDRHFLLLGCYGCSDIIDFENFARLLHYYS